MKSVTLALCLALAVATADAAEDQYVCTIERAYSLGPSGLRTDRRLLRALDTRSFTIDRSTGAVTGSTLENLQYSATVVSRGDSDNSFQAYWVVRGRAVSRVRVVEVQEFAESPSKPFRAVVQNWTYTGYCE